MPNNARRPLTPDQIRLRLARVEQQFGSFADLHAAELGELILQLENGDLELVATRLRSYRDLHRQEADLVLESLADLAADVAPESPSAAPAVSSTKAIAETSDRPIDPAANSAKRTRWLADRARHFGMRLITRRGFLMPWKDR